jgi:hypothetical protein
MAKKETKTRVKKEVVKEVKVVEEVVDNTPKRYYVDFYLKKEPIAKDENVGTIFYSDTTGLIEVEGLAVNHSSEIENLMLGDIWFMDGAKQIFVSRYETPKDWVLNLHKAVITKVLYASEAKINNETE